MELYKGDTGLNMPVRRTCSWLIKLRGENTTIFIRLFSRNYSRRGQQLSEERAAIVRGGGSNI